MNRSFLSQFRSRSCQVKIATKIGRENHIIQATIRAIWGHLYQNGFTIVGHIANDIVQTTYVPFVRNAIASLITVGYFAYIIEDGLPIILDPNTYVLVPTIDIPSSRSTNAYTVVFITQRECDRYNKMMPVPYIQYAPDREGNLTCPSMQLVDMHDALIEFIRLALLNDAINLRPKAWVSEKDTTTTQGVYQFLPMEERDRPTRGFPQGLANGQPTLNREGKRAYTRDQNSLLSQVQHSVQSQEPRAFTTACFSRTMDIDALHDPSIMVHVNPNTEITAMGATHTRSDLVQLVQLFDQRMCTALGVPPHLLGQPGSRFDNSADVRVVELWENIIAPYREMINLALVSSVEETYVKFAAKQYKLTKDARYITPVRISIEPQISRDTILSLQPFLKQEAFNKLLAHNTGLDVADFRVEEKVVKEGE